MIDSIVHKRCLEAMVALRSAEVRLREADTERSAAGDLADIQVPEREFRLAADRLRAALAAVPELLLELTSEGRCRHYQPSSAEAAGRSSQDCAGGQLSEIFPPDAEEVIRSALREAREEGVSVGKEFRLPLSDEHLSFAVSVFGKAGELSEEPRFTVVLRDITAHGPMGQQRTEVFKFFELSSDPMCIADPYGCFKQVNRALVELTGYSPSELISRPFLDFVVPEDRGRTAEEMRLQVDVRPSKRFENRYRCKDGRVVTLSWTAYFDKRDGVTYATARDITDRKRREDEYHTILQASIDGFWVTDFSGRILEVNESVCRMLGYSREELLSMSISDIDADESPEEIAARTREMIEAGSALFQARHRRKDGKVVDVEVSVVSVATLGDRFFVFIRNISERKQAEASLREARSLLEDVEKLSKLGGWQYDAATQRIVWTEEVYRIYGVGRDYDPSDVVRDIGFYEGEHAALIAAAFSRAVAEGEPYDLELRLRRANGERIWVRTTGKPVIENGKVVRVTGNVVDITEQKEMREALRESEQRLRMIFDTEPECVKLVARDGRLVEMNAAGVAMLEADSLAAVQERALVSFVVPEYRAAFSALHERVMNGENATLEFQMEGLNGARRWVETHAAPIRDATGEVTMLLGISRDITERKKAEEERRMIEAQLWESQKMEALGALAGGVAHDFNNIIASIMGNAELARQDIGAGHAAAESLDEISKASRRAQDLVRQILAFGRRQVSAREVVSLAPVVEEAGRLLRTTLPAGIALSVECAPDVPRVLADATQIEQVILNLCGNAWHAVQGQGRPGLIEIRLEAEDRRAAGGRSSAAHDEVPPGRYACLTVRDNGRGMDEPTLARIFEPFFTTKPVGEGTGLGLAVVHGIVHEHGASVLVHSEPGQGSTFRVYLPAAEAPGSVAAVEALAASPPVQGKGRHVLFVDDDEAIVFLMKRLLERQGYRVSAYTDPREAVRVARAEPDAFDLVVTDYNMPGMSGLDLARELLEIRADLPLALASGYITEELREQARLAKVSELIYKPNTVDDLCAAVARLASARVPRS